MTAIASRTYEVDGRPGLTVQVFSPRRYEGSKGWRCEFEIDGPLTKLRSEAAGADALQALLFAVYQLHNYLRLSEEYVGGRLGFDEYPGFLDLPEFQAHPRHPGIPAGYAGGPEPS